MSEYEYEGDAQSVPPREVIEYFEIPFRRPLMTLVPLFVIPVLSVGLFKLSPKWYQSSTMIVVESQKAPEALIGEGAVGKNAKEELRTIQQEILSRTRIERIIKELEPYPEQTGKASMSAIVEKMRASIVIETKAADAFFVAYTHKNPYLAMAVTNRLVTLFIEEAGEARTQQIEAANRFIDDQLEEARKALEVREQELRALRATHMGSLPEQLAANLSALQRLQFERQTLNDNLRSAEERRLLIESRLAEELGGSPASRIPFTNGSRPGRRRPPPADQVVDPVGNPASITDPKNLTDPAVLTAQAHGKPAVKGEPEAQLVPGMPQPGTELPAGLNARLEAQKVDGEEVERAREAAVAPMSPDLAKLMGELAVLRRRGYTDAHPDVVPILKQVERLEEWLASQPASVMGAASNNPRAAALQEQANQSQLEIERLYAQQDDADDRIVELEMRVAQTPQVEQELLSLTRDYTKLEGDYQTMLARKTQAEMAAALERQWKAQRFRMLDPAFLPDRPYSPILGKYLAIGLSIGLLLGLGLSVGAELLDHSIKNERELEVLLRLPHLVTIPRVKSRRFRAPFKLHESLSPA